MVLNLSQVLISLKLGMECGCKTHPQKYFCSLLDFIPDRDIETGIYESTPKENTR